eukprot:TRINITY_DN9160_c0_g2_i4.p1 TRINITY_DN9160_c0_g2~~TRINITY_DN9160_c0_g2_i4.p1  ORF type:complete len:330 (+),score=44.42 TRINITY_DN9160_c0_g2_i4:62-991(+)
MCIRDRSTWGILFCRRHKQALTLKFFSVISMASNTNNPPRNDFQDVGGAGAPVNYEQVSNPQLGYPGTRPPPYQPAAYGYGQAPMNAEMVAVDPYGRPLVGQPAGYPPGPYGYAQGQPVGFAPVIGQPVYGLPPPMLNPRQQQIMNEEIYYRNISKCPICICYAFLVIEAFYVIANTLEFGRLKEYECGYYSIQTILDWISSIIFMIAILHMLRVIKMADITKIRPTIIWTGVSLSLDYLSFIFQILSASNCILPDDVASLSTPAIVIAVILTTFVHVYFISLAKRYSRNIQRLKEARGEALHENMQRN